MKGLCANKIIEVDLVPFNAFLRLHNLSLEVIGSITLEKQGDVSISFLPLLWYLLPLRFYQSSDV